MHSRKSLGGAGALACAEAPASAFASETKRPARTTGPPYHCARNGHGWVKALLMAAIAPTLALKYHIA